MAIVSKIIFIHIYIRLHINVYIVYIVYIVLCLLVMSMGVREHFSLGRTALKLVRQP